MKNVIIGTAGHVDHGKTKLIAALTGTDTDRLKEEKRRGITIELGFAHLALPDGSLAGIIDVPGHEKFIRHMLAGAGGIDLALLVVAADEGFMPQTREHLDILTLLELRHGIIALTKADLVVEEWMAGVVQEVTSQVAGTFLEQAPILPVSAHTGVGVEKLRQEIFRQLDLVRPKETAKPFRLPIDRIFSMEGFGTVVTGTCIEGALRLGDQVAIYPTGETARVRGLQVYGQPVSAVQAGQRTAVNLAGIKKEEVVRGNVLAQPDSMLPSQMLDVRLDILKGCQRSITSGQRLHFHHGAGDTLCKLVLLGTEHLSPGERGFAQLRFAHPVCVKQGDRFVVRFYSPLETVGGGVVLDANPPKHKAKDPRVVTALSIKEAGTFAQRLRQSILESRHHFWPLEEMLRRASSQGERVEKELEQLIAKGEIIMLCDNIPLHRDYLWELGENLARMLSQYHKEHPLQAGMPWGLVRSKLLPGLDPLPGDQVLNLLVEQGIAKKQEHCLALPDFAVVFTPAQRRVADALIAFYREGGFAPPDPTAAARKFSREREYHRVLQALLADGRLVMVEPFLFDGEAYCKARQLLEQVLARQGQVTLGGFRDLLQTSRKYALALLEQFDRQGITQKSGDVRTPGQGR